MNTRDQEPEPNEKSPRRPTASEIGARYGIRQDDMHKASVAQPRDLVCMEAYISGWEDEAERAKKFIGKETTTELPNVKVFFTSRRDFLYVHSNFIKGECYYPTKIITNKPWRLDDVAANLIATKSDLDSPYFPLRFWRAMVEHFIFYVDEILLLGERFSLLDFSEISNVFVITAGDETVPITKWKSDRKAKEDAQSRELVRNSALLTIEIIAACVAAVFGILWLWKGDGTYEAITFLCLLVGSTVVDLVRRRMKPTG